MQSVILHHYPQSPVTEKVRVVLGMKSIKWYSVEIPRIPPKPDLMPLTGGYRRTPVMQIGADVYCDSLCIIRELERRFPQPSLFPNHSEGLSWGLSQWFDGPVFTHAVTIILASAESLPEDFAADRGRLYFGPDFSLSELKNDVDHSISQLYSQFSWLEKQIIEDGPFMLGKNCGLVDALAYYLIWFIRGRWHQGPKWLGNFPNLESWEVRMSHIGHGTQEEMDSKRALEIAKLAEPECIPTNSAHNESFGAKVNVTPEGDGGDPEVTGHLVDVTDDQISLRRIDPDLGNICVHFPRVGYRIKEL
jgi:glutathione S-transferase